MITRSLTIVCLVVQTMNGPSLETVLSRAGEYVQSYEPALGMMIAREIYVQRVPLPSGPSPSFPIFGGRSGPGSLPPAVQYNEQRLLSDFLMVRFTAEDGGWMGVRAVLEVNGRPVFGQLERLQDALQGSSETAIDRWQKLAEENTRYNIGHVDRSINVPTFALVLLHPRHRDRFEFEHIGKEVIEGVNSWIIQYQERIAPALITDQNGNNLFVYGKIWINPIDGRVVRTEMLTGNEDSDLRSEITVIYKPDVGLGLWVPHEMKESYSSRDGRHFDATATYSNFQKFQVSVETELEQ